MKSSKTRRGVYINIDESDYKVEIKGFCFYFSSLFYRKKFLDSLNEINYSNFKLRLSYITKYNINCDILFLFYLYNKIEKRGFKVITPQNNNIVTNKLNFDVILDDIKNETI